MALEKTVQISGIRGPYSVEQVTSFLPGKMYVEWDAQPADNWVLYITDQAAQTKLTVQIGKLTAEDIQQYKDGHYGTFETEVSLPASLCPTSNLTQLQVYITGSTRITSGSITLPVNYRSNTVSITLQIPTSSEYYPSWYKFADETKINPKHTVTNLVLGEEGQRFLLAGESTFTSTGYYTPGIGAEGGSVAASVLIGVNEDFQYEDSNSIWITPIKDTTLGQDDVYTYEYRYNLNEPNTYRFEFFVFDARGRWGAQAATATSIVKVWDYAQPSVNLDVQRTIGVETPSVTCKYKCTHSELGNNGNLLKQLHIERKDLNAEHPKWESWYVSENLTENSGTITIPMSWGSPTTDNSIYAAHEWAFRGWVDDTIMRSKYPTDAERRDNSAMSKVSQIQSEFRVFNIHKGGKGLAVGKIATEADKLDINIPTIFRDNVTFEKSITANGLKDAYNTDRILKCSYIDEGAFTNPAALVGCKLGDNGPRYANISTAQALSLLGLSSLEGLDIKFGQVALEYSANTGGSTNDIFISGLSDVLFAAVMPCFDTGNILLKRNDDGSIYYTSSSTGIHITAIIPKLTANGTRNTTWMAIGHKK